MTEFRRNEIAFLLFRAKMKEEGTKQFIATNEELILRQSDQIRVPENEVREFLATTVVTIHDTPPRFGNIDALCNR